MFGSPSNPFGQSSSSSPFGTQTQPVFGQNNNASSNLFAPKPFGSSTPFGAQTGSSMFGGTATGVFGATQTSCPFGASSQGFGSSTPAFGASSAPAFGNSASPFGGNSTFGQKSFGFSTPQSSPFGSTTQQSQPAFGNSTFGSSTPFGASNTPAFGSTNTPAFGSTNTPAFGSTNTPAFGASSTPAFGASSSPAFGTSPTPAFGSSGTAFGNNAFGSGGAFGASSTPAFGASSTPAFGASSTPAFGASSTPAFSFGSSPAFGQSNSAFSSTQSPFGVQGAQASSQTPFGVQQVGSRVMPYAPTTETETSTGAAAPGKLQSISAMTVYNNKSHEELRWEDYQRGDKGGQLAAVQNSQPSVFSQSSANPFSQPSANQANAFSSPNLFSQPSGNQTNAFSSPNLFSQQSANQTNAFSNPNPFAPKNPTTTPNFSSSFAQPSTSSMFATTSSNTTSVFGPPITQPFGTSSNPAFSSSPSLFSSSSTPGFASSPSNFSSAQTPAFNTGGNFNNSQSSPLFSSNSSPLQNTNPPFPQTSNFSTPSTGFSNMFASSPSLNTSNSPFSQTTPGLTPYQPAQPAQTSGGFSFNISSQTQPAQSSGAFSFNNSGQTQPAQTSGAFSFNNLSKTQPGYTTSFPGGMPSFTQGNSGPATANTTVMQPNTIANPFGTLPALPQMSIAQGRNSPSLQYGISSMPVVDKPTPARVSPLLTSRHLLQRHVRLPSRKYRPGDDGPKVPFFGDEQENSNTPKADAYFIPRENPRALFIRPVEKEKLAPPKDGPTPLQENGKSSNGVTNGANLESKANGETRDAPPLVKANQKPNATHENHGVDDKNGSNSLPSGADIESLMPKLHHAEYFTEPRIQELAAKERVNPGYCGRVKDFVVGRHGYGSIKFLGETDMRKLDLEMLVQFNNREVIVYMDESKKPPVGEGLNKPAEVTLLNIKCIDKKSGKQVKEGPRVDKYKEMLKRKAEEQGAKFVSFDAVSGEWKFKVEHFSSYMLGDEDDV